jgi:NAD(P)-dependent dehydrogenase (short-subunit alcohol dehydrogenase family)
MTSTSKIALITGGSRGLGRNTAEHLAKKGIDLIVTYNSNREDADAVVAEARQVGVRAAALKLDTTRTDTFAAFGDELRQTLLQTFDRETIDFLVNNAGTGIHKPFAETTEEDFDHLVAIHLKGVFFLTQHLLPTIEDGGRIVNVSSGLARFTLPGYSAYAAMKGGIEVLTRYLAKELGARRISVNTIAPGAIETDFGGGVVRDNAHVNEMVAATTAMGRAGLPDDIGGALSSLLVGEFGWMTGQRIEVSGGQNI